MKIILSDTFNNRVISRHLSLEAAVKKQRKYSKALSKWSKGSYLWYGYTYSDGTKVDPELLESVEFMVDNQR